MSAAVLEAPAGIAPGAEAPRAEARAAEAPAAEARAVEGPVAAAPAAEAPATLFADARAEGPAGGGRTTLAELLDATWLAARGAADAECPICHEQMHLKASAAHCGSCGTTLS